MLARIVQLIRGHRYTKAFRHHRAVAQEKRKLTAKIASAGFPFRGWSINTIPGLPFWYVFEKSPHCGYWRTVYRAALLRTAMLWAETNPKGGAA